MQIVNGLLQIAGSLGLFLFGMKFMSDGIQKSAGERLRTIINYMTINRFAAVGTGFLVTSLVQSSSATTVMVVSFVSAGLLSLTQAIGVIMGANIGTTVTGWIVALIGFKVNVSAVALPAIGIGLPLFMARKLDRREWGETLIGFGLLFMGLKFLKESVPDIRSSPEVLEFLTRFTGRGFLSFILFVVTGTVLTFIVQSSSAAMAITLTMAYSGWIDFPTAAAIVLGENIGTTITAYIASLGANVDARRAARFHLLFNCIGVIWMAAVFRPFLALVDYFIPGEIVTADGITSHLAMFHTLFNVTNTLLFLGFVRQMTWLVERLVKKKAEEVENVYRLKYIATGIQDTPEINIMNAKKEICRMAEITEDMFSIFLNVFYHPNTKMRDEVEKLKQMEDFTDQMQEQISLYLIECLKENLNATSAANVNSMIRIVNELESIGDSCYNLILLSERRYRKKMSVSKRAMKEIEPFSQVVMEFLELSRSYLESHPGKIDLTTAYEMEDSINSYRNEMKKLAQKRLSKGADVRSELLFIDIVKHIEHIGDFSLNISRALRAFG